MLHVPHTSPCPSCSPDPSLLLLRTGSLGTSPSLFLASPPFVTPRASHFLPFSSPFDSQSSLSLNYPCSLFFPHTQPLCAHSCCLAGGVAPLAPVWLKHRVLPTLLQPSPGPAPAQVGPCPGNLPKHHRHWPTLGLPLPEGHCQGQEPLGEALDVQCPGCWGQGAQGSGRGVLEGKQQPRDLTPR